MFFFLNIISARLTNLVFWIYLNFSSILIILGHFMIFKICFAVNILDTWDSWEIDNISKPS